MNARYNPASSGFLLPYDLYVISNYRMNDPKLVSRKFEFQKFENKKCLDGSVINPMIVDTDCVENK